MNQIKINQKVLIPKVTVELEDGSYISNSTYNDDINFNIISAKLAFSLKLNKQQLLDLKLLLDTYIETRYENTIKNT